ncbi:hypothetical protein D3C76_1565840 [compost metagenome]
MSSTLSTPVSSSKKPKREFRLSVLNSRRRSAKLPRPMARKKPLAVNASHVLHRVAKRTPSVSHVLSNRRQKPRVRLVKSRATLRFLTLAS